MNTQAKIDYNKRSAENLGWFPELFGAVRHNEELIEKITDFQKEHDLTPDGLCGPMTYARALTQREANQDTDYIVCNGEAVTIGWDKTINLFHENSKRLPLNCYKSVVEDRTSTMIVTHWDAALS